MMELRHLRYFVAVTEHGSITQAARRVNIAQPALTKQIHDLEEELGFELFERRARGVALTAAGRQFLVDATRILDDASAAKVRGLRASNGQVGALSIGMTALHGLHPVFAAIMRAVREEIAEVSLSIHQVLSGPQIESIRSGKLDAGFLFFRPSNDETLDAELIDMEPLVLAVPRDSRWATKPPRRLRELNDEGFIWFPRGASPTYHDQLIHCFRKAGFTPQVTHQGSDNTALLSMVAAGIGCTILPETAGMSAPASVVCLNVADLDIKLPLELVWRSDNQSPALQRFVAIARAEAHRSNRATAKSRRR